MRSKISVIGGEDRAMVVKSLTDGRADVVDATRDRWADVAASEVVVLLDGVDVAQAAAAVARRAPGAVLLVATEDAERDCDVALQASLLPRPRIVGVAREDLTAAVDAVVYGREVELRAAALCRGELGVGDRVATVPLRLGARGIAAIG